MRLTKPGWVGPSSEEISIVCAEALAGDKYDSKINRFADGQINDNIPGGAGKK